MRFRKKPVVIEAKCAGGDNQRPTTSWRVLAEWCGGDLIHDSDGQVVGLVIHTPEGDMRAEVGDYIIRGVQGEFYPCKPDIFEATYEKVEDDR